jgi:hypothetical protein
MRKNITLTHNKIHEITEHIKAGNFTVVACGLAGISERTYYHWLKLGKEPGGGIYSELYNAVKKAEAEREAALVLKLAKSNDLKVTMWMLERIAPERWGRLRDRTEQPSAERGRDKVGEEVEEPTTLNPVWTKGGSST